MVSMITIEHYSRFSNHLAHTPKGDKAARLMENFPKMLVTYPFLKA